MDSLLLNHIDQITLQNQDNEMITGFKEEQLPDKVQNHEGYIMEERVDLACKMEEYNNGINTPILKQTIESHPHKDYHGESPFLKFCKGLSPLTQSPIIIRDPYHTQFRLFGAQNPQTQKSVVETPSPKYSRQIMGQSPNNFSQKNTRPLVLKKIVEKIDLSIFQNESTPQGGQQYSKNNYRFNQTQNSHDQQYKYEQTKSQQQLYSISTADTECSIKHNKLNNNTIHSPTKNLSGFYPLAQQSSFKKQLFTTPQNFNKKIKEQYKSEDINKFQEFNTQQIIDNGLNKYSTPHSNTHQSSDGDTSNIKQRKITCNCKKSKCLKLYCDCLKEGLTCKNCNCVGCANTEDNLEERNRVLSTLLNIQETNSEIQSTGIIYDQERGILRHKKGCNCKKSGCAKKYCECFLLGVKCTDLCKCTVCRNCWIDDNNQHEDTNISTKSLLKKRKNESLVNQIKEEEEIYQENEEYNEYQNIYKLQITNQPQIIQQIYQEIGQIKQEEKIIVKNEPNTYQEKDKEGENFVQCKKIQNQKKNQFQKKTFKSQTKKSQKQKKTSRMLYKAQKSTQSKNMKYNLKTTKIKNQVSMIVIKKLNL